MTTDKEKLPMDDVRKGDLSQAEVYQWLADLRHKAHVPESRYPVSAVFRATVEGEDDYYFAGVNVENMDHRLSTHAEEASIAGIVTALGNQAKIAEAWIMGGRRSVQPGDKSKLADAFASCCGKCRQQIAGMAIADTQLHYVSISGNVETTSVAEFLPGLFTFKYRDPAAHEDSHAPTVEKIKKQLVRKGPLSDEEIADWAKSVGSDDNVSKVSQSVILKLDNGYYAAGTKVTVIGHLDISAVQSAVANAQTVFGASTVQEAWVYTKGHDAKAFTAGSFGTLPGSALQVLAEFTTDGEMPIHFLGDDGLVVQKTLDSAAKIVPTSRKPVQKITL